MDGDCCSRVCHALACAGVVAGAVEVATHAGWQIDRYGDLVVGPPYDCPGGGLVGGCPLGVVRDAVADAILVAHLGACGGRWGELLKK